MVWRFIGQNVPENLPPFPTPHSSPCSINTRAHLHSACFPLTPRQDARCLGYGTHPGRLGRWFHQKAEAPDTPRASLAGWSLWPPVCVQPQNPVARPSSAILKQGPKIKVCCSLWGSWFPEQQTRQSHFPLMPKQQAFESPEVRLIRGGREQGEGNRGTAVLLMMNPASRSLLQMQKFCSPKK